MRITALLLIGALTACSWGRPADEATGEEIYAQLCARCHGSDLSGAVGPPVGPGSDAAAESDEFLVFTIVNGRGRMPSLEYSLSDDQVDRLVVFMREQQNDD